MSADGYVGELLELPQGCQVPFRCSRGKVGFLSRRRSRKGPHLALRGESPVFFSSCGRKLGVPLKLQWRPHGPAHVASGKSSLHVSSEGPLNFLSNRCWNLGPHLELRLKPQCSSPLLTWISEFLCSFNRGVRPRLMWRHASPLSSRPVTVVSGFLSS